MSGARIENIPTDTRDSINMLLSNSVPIKVWRMNDELKYTRGRYNARMEGGETERGIRRVRSTY